MIRSLLFVTLPFAFTIASIETHNASESLTSVSILGVFADSVCTLIARIVSSAVNFTINKKKVFRSSASLQSSLLRYYLLAAGIMILSSASISVVTIVFSLADGKYALLKTLCKFLIDSILFLISFRAQREWVFATPQKTSQKIN